MKVVTIQQACNHWEAEKWNPSRCRHCFQSRDKHDSVSASGATSSSSSASSYSAAPAAASSSSKVLSTATKFGGVKSSQSGFVRSSPASTSSPSLPVNSSKSSFVPAAAPRPLGKSASGKSGVRRPALKTSKSSFVPASQQNSTQSGEAPWAVKLRPTGRPLADTSTSSSSTSYSASDDTPSTTNQYAALYAAPQKAGAAIAPLERNTSTSQSGYLRKDNVSKAAAPSSSLSRSVSNPHDQRSVVNARRDIQDPVQARKRQQQLDNAKVVSETGYFVEMLYDYEANGQKLYAGDLMGLVNWDDPSWWFVTRNPINFRGYVPSDYVKSVDQPSTTPAASTGSEATPPARPPKDPSLVAAMKGKSNYRPNPNINTPAASTASNSKPIAKKAMANFDFKAVNKGEINCQSGDIVIVLDHQDPNWWFVRHTHSLQTGFLPASYLALLPDEPSSQPATPQRPRDAPSHTSVQTSNSSTKLQAYAMYDFDAQSEGELSCKYPELFTVLDNSEEDWWFVERKQGGQTGWLPSAYLSLVDQDTIDAYIEKKRISTVPVQTGGGNQNYHHPGSNHAGGGAGHSPRSGYQHAGAIPIPQQPQQQSQSQPQDSNCIIS